MPEIDVDIVWDGIRKIDSIKDELARRRHAIADAARNYDWPQVIDLVTADINLVNVSRLGGSSLYAPLHQAAHGGAPISVATRLIELGAWRTLQNVAGERPVDVADRQGHQHLLGVLTPTWKRHVPIGVLLRIQTHFHAVIRARIDHQLPDHGLRLPELEPLLELEQPQMWFPVPGMYGGFNYRLVATGVEAKLVSESWSRVVGGSGQRHLITSMGSELLEEGFV
jgi:hypothetical protein